MEHISIIFVRIIMAKAIKKPHVTVSLQVYLVKEDSQFVAYCPALELSSYGDDMDDAKEAFKEALNIFIEETVSRGTLERELLDLGWQLQRKPRPFYQPVVISSSSSRLIPNTQKVFQERVSLPLS